LPRGAPRAMSLYIQKKTLRFYLDSSYPFFETTAKDIKYHPETIKKDLKTIC